jgi:hypothetical protein
MDPRLVTALLVVGAFCLGVLFTRYGVGWRRKPAMGMTKKEYDFLVNQRFNDRLGDIIEDMRHKGEANDYWCEKWMRQLAASRGRYGWKDMRHPLPGSKEAKRQVTAVKVVDLEEQPVVQLPKPKKTFSDRFRELFIKPS